MVRISPESYMTTSSRKGSLTASTDLIVVAYGEVDHWKGLPRLLGFDAQASSPRSQWWKSSVGSRAGYSEK